MPLDVSSFLQKMKDHPENKERLWDELLQERKERLKDYLSGLVLLHTLKGSLDILPEKAYPYLIVPLLHLEKENHSLMKEYAFEFRKIFAADPVEIECKSLKQIIAYLISARLWVTLIKVGAKIELNPLAKKEEELLLNQCQYLEKQTVVNPLIFWCVGYMHYSGICTQEANDLAVAYFRRAADKGYDTAEYYLGYCLLKGMGGQNNKREGIKWLRKAAAQGHPEAQFELGMCRYNGIDIEKNAIKAVGWFRKAANQGHIRGLHNLAYCYLNGEGVRQDKGLAIELYRCAAEQGYSFAQYDLGVYLYQGDGVVVDKTKAVEWMRRAARQGHVNAQCDYGQFLASGVGVEKNEKEAVYWYRKAAIEGNAAAQFYLGRCLRKGIGIEIDKCRAVIWYRKAAIQGNLDAQTDLGCCLQNGIGIEKDEQQAAEWFEKAAIKGFAYAQRNYALCLAKGEGVVKNEEQALFLLWKAAQQGEISAQEILKRFERTFDSAILFNLAYRLQTHKDEKNAIEWYTKAAKKGNSNAMFALGRCYEFGIGVEKDEARKVKWYGKAAKKGHALAEMKLKSSQTPTVLNSGLSLTVPGIQAVSVYPAKSSDVLATPPAYTSFFNSGEPVGPATPVTVFAVAEEPSCLVPPKQLQIS